MRGQLIFFTALLTLAASQIAYAQNGQAQPTCEVACRVNPFTAPTSCNCDGAGNETETPTPAESAPAEPTPQTEPAPPLRAEPTQPRPPAEPGVVDCEVACRVNPFTAPADCNCNGSTASGVDSGVGGGTESPAASSSPAPVAAPVTDAALRDLVLRSWAAQPGETVRNSFGPNASDCRGACGPGCASVQSCERGARYECLDAGRLLRIETYSCGTHQGCRIHDDCLDRCHQANEQGVDCEASCHLEAMAEYGPENAMSWLQGGGPYDPEPSFFEYTRSAPDMPEPFYRCAEGTRRECGGGAARCVTAAGVEVEPVFDSFPEASRTIGVAGFRSGRLCEQGPGGSTVCEQTVDIQVTGADACAQGAGNARCTRFGFEFDYQRADPAVPLVCSASSRGGSRDLASVAVAQALSPVVGQDTDLGAAAGGIQEALRSGQSLESVFSGISIAQLDENGKPVESTRVGANPAPAAAPPTPNRVALEGASGRLVVPLYELHDPARSGEVVEREVECSYSGAPVLETLFRLHHTGN